MKTENESVTPYPKDDIDPKHKDEKWILDNAKARWEHSRMYCGDVLWHGREEIAELRTYMSGWQSVERAKRQLLTEEQEDDSYYTIDWTERPLMTTYFEKGVSKILQRDYNIICTAINERAQTEQDAYYNKLRIKLLIRKTLQQVNPELANNPALQTNPGEPETLEELDMYMQYGYKHTMSMYGEMSVNLAFKENDFDGLRKDTVINLYGLGVGGYKDYIDHNGKARIIDIKPEDLVVSYCEKRNFSDATHIGAVLPKTFGEIARYFSKEDLVILKKQCANQWGNPALSDRRWSSNEYLNFKCMVWDLEFMSYNDSQYEMSVDKYGNLKTSKISYNADPEARKKNAAAKGGPVPQYERDTEEVVYKTCWVIGTDFQYNFGLATNQKRTLSDPRRTKFSYHLEAWNFEKMQFAGVAKRLRPMQDEYQLLSFKLQNFRNKWIPYIIKIDVAALEKTAMKGKTGKIMTPLQLLDFMFQQHILMLRQDALGEGANPNYKAIEIIRTEMAEEFEVIFKDMERINAEMEKIAGFNTVSAGGNVDPRMLSDGYAASLAGTQDSLYLISDADKKLIQRVAMGVLQRQQIAVKMGQVSGYVNTIGPAGVRFIKIDPGISLYDYGIFAEDKPDAAKREQFLQKVEKYQEAGFIEPQDLIMIDSCSNLKQAEINLEFRINKRKKEKQNDLLQSQALQQQGTVTNQQLAMQAKAQELTMASDLRIKEINAEKQWDYIIQQGKSAGSKEEAQIHAQSKIIAQQIIEDGKRNAPTK